MTSKKSPPKKSNCAHGRGDPMFNIGDMAVYPTHGVGVIEAIEEKKISGKGQKF